MLSLYYKRAIFGVICPCITKVQYFTNLLLYELNSNDNEMITKIEYDNAYVLKNCEVRENGDSPVFHKKKRINLPESFNQSTIL